MTRTRTTAIGLTLATLLGAARCIPTYEFAQGAAPGDAGTLPDGAPVHPSGDATLPGDDDDGATPHNDATTGGDDGSTVTPIDAPTSFPTTPTTIMASTGVNTSTGNAQQQHLIFVTGSQRWWFFYFDAEPNLLHTMWSIDFVTWTAGASLTLPRSHGGEGRNLSVAYKSIGGHDILHAATSLHDTPKRVIYDTRATISGATITWETPVVVHDLDVLPDGGTLGDGTQGADFCDPDGPGVTLATDGRVTVATSWVAIPGCCSCDSNFATSLGPDTGGGWDAGFPVALQHVTVPGTTSARQVISLSTGPLLAGWESGDGTPPTDVSWGTNGSGAFGEEGQDDDPNFWVFPQPGTTQIQEKNDWSFCRIDDNDIHAVHRKYAQLADGGSTGESRVFEHYRFNGSKWTFQSALADDVGVPGSGVTLVTNGTGLLAATIANDGSDSVRYATWNGSTWSGWASVPGASTGDRRGYISGSGCGDPGHPAILWTEGASAPYKVIALSVATLMP